MVRPARAKSNQWPPEVVAAATNGDGADVPVAAALVALALVVLAALALAPVVVLDEALAAEAAGVTAGAVRTFALPGVGLVVQLQVSSDRAQALPVGALG